MGTSDDTSARAQHRCRHAEHDETTGSEYHKAGHASSHSGDGAGDTAARPATPSDYRIGTEDVLGILFWREMEMSGDVTVRPDGMITLPLLGDVRAVGLSTDQLRDILQKNAAKILTDANVTVVVRQINSRKVYVTGQVGMSGAYPLIGPRTVLQAIAMAGGLTEYAKGEEILIVRGSMTFKFNYKEVLHGRKLEQNIQLQPGDQVLGPETTVTSFLRLLLVVFVLLAATAAVSEAQILDRPSRPFRGVFGGAEVPNPNRTRSELTFFADLLGGYDSNLAPEGSVPAQTNTIPASGFTGLADLVLRYWHGQAARTSKSRGEGTSRPTSCPALNHWSDRTSAFEARRGSTGRPG